MKLDFQLELPEIESVQDLIDDFNDNPHHDYYHINIHHECHGFTECFGRLVDYMTSCFN